MKQGKNWQDDLMEFPLPAYIQLYPTTKCNQRCSFCFNPDNPPVPDLALKDSLLLLDILAENRTNNIDIMGGEPLLLPWIADFVAAGTSYGISFNISTNGSMPHLLDSFRGIPRGHFNIGISLEGSTPERHNRLTGSDNFSKALQSIKKLITLSLDPAVKTVLSRETADDIQNIVNLIRRIGVRRYHIIHMDIFSKKNGAGTNAFPYPAFLEFYRAIRTENPDMDIHRVNASCFDRDSLPAGVRCAGGVRKLSVLPDGTTYPCNLFHNMTEFAIGNIFRDRFADIWSHPRLDLFRRYRGNRCSISPCQNRQSCTGGCPAHAYYHFGDRDMPDVRCLSALRGQTVTGNLYL